MPKKKPPQGAASSGGANGLLGRRGGRGLGLELGRLGRGLHGAGHHQQTHGGAHEQCDERGTALCVAGGVHCSQQRRPCASLPVPSVPTAVPDPRSFFVDYVYNFRALPEEPVVDQHDRPGEAQPRYPAHPRVLIADRQVALQQVNAPTGQLLLASYKTPPQPTDLKHIVSAPFAIAQLQLYLLLKQLGAKPDPDRRLAVFLTNALSGWHDHGDIKLNFPEMREEFDASQRVKRDARIILVLGNPPYDRYTGAAQAEEAADALHRGVAVLLGVLAQQLQRVQRTVGRPADDVGEGAAAVDPELPARGLVHRRTSTTVRPRTLPSITLGAKAMASLRAISWVMLASCSRETWSASSCQARARSSLGVSTLLMP